MDGHTPPKGVTVTSMPSSYLLEKFNNLPKEFAFLAFDANGVINMVLPEALSIDGGRTHVGVLSAKAVLSLCANKQISDLIAGLVQQQRDKLALADAGTDIETDNNQPSVVESPILPN